MQSIIIDTIAGFMGWMVSPGRDVLHHDGEHAPRLPVRGMGTGPGLTCVAGKNCQRLEGGGGAPHMARMGIILSPTRFFFSNGLDSLSMTGHFLILCLK